MDERLSFAVPDIDQLLDQLEVELAADEKAHSKPVGDDKPVITDKPVDDDVPEGSAPNELEGREDHGSIVAVAHEDLKGGSLRPPPKPKPRSSSPAPATPRTSSDSRQT